MTPSSGSTKDTADAVVIGAGHNGLVAAALLADAGWDVLVLEAQGEPGGAVKSSELTPGYVSDLYSAFYPLSVASPALTELNLEDHGLRWSRAPAVVGHAREAADEDAAVEVDLLDGHASNYLAALQIRQPDSWRHLPLAMVPDQWYDINGVWTGSATVFPDGTLSMLYTGSTNAWVQVQYIAVTEDPNDSLHRKEHDQTALFTTEVGSATLNGGTKGRIRCRKRYGGPLIGSRRI
jgi:choline dehydrogenase-like flavoprotein